MVEQTEQLEDLEAAQGQLEDVKQSLDDAQYTAQDLESYASSVTSSLADIEYSLDEAIGRVEGLVEELRSTILEEANNEANKS